MMRLPLIPLTLLTLLRVPAEAAPVVEEMIVRAALPPSPGDKAYAQTVYEPNDLVGGAPRLDDLLRQTPGFGLFRRTSSRDAHPTTQGASIRGIGPNGAGRSLILLDGVPQNDPFGGWVYWSALPVTDVTAVTVTRGGGAGPWGNNALAGAVRIATLPAETTGASIRASAGNENTWDMQGRGSLSAGPWGLTVTAARFETGGHFALRPADRGAIDRRLASDSTWARLRLAHDNGLGRHISLSFSAADEARVNGTALALNDTQSYDGALRFVQQDAEGHGLEATLYAVGRRFENVFSSAAEDRMSEIPALDQFDVPARAVGGNLIWRRPWGAATVELGGDARWAKGATHERFLFQAGQFRRLREAGGEQGAVGLFVEVTAPLAAATRITGGARLDYLADFDGFRREFNSDTGIRLRDDPLDGRDRLALNGRFGLSHDFSSALHARAAVYSGFRQPTINELYRPFRVRNDITEANPALRDERLMGVDGGLTWRPDPQWEITVGGFWTVLQDGVANVLIADTPGFYPEFGVFLPVGGTLSQRRNLDRVRTQGLELTAAWRMDETLRLTLSYLLVDGKVTRAQDAPALVGKRPPQTARHQGSVALQWQPTPRWRVSALARGESSQFDDAANSRTLDGYVTADVTVRWQAAGHVALILAVENLGDTRIQTALSADGLVTLGAPRLWRLGLEAVY